jgi:hypothetical protein
MPNLKLQKKSEKNLKIILNGQNLFGQRLWIKKIQKEKLEPEELETIKLT